MSISISSSSSAYTFIAPAAPTTLTFRKERTPQRAQAADLDAIQPDIQPDITSARRLRRLLNDREASSDNARGSFKRPRQSRSKEKKRRAPGRLAVKNAVSPAAARRAGSRRRQKETASPIQRFLGSTPSTRRSPPGG